MFPLIVVSSDKESIDTFITSYIAKNGYVSYTVTRVEPVKDELAISQIRELKRDLLIQQKEIHLIILSAFDSASLEAQNAFLKTLEEENDRFQFIMTASNEQMILPTVRSRSKVMYIKPSNSIIIEKEIKTFLTEITESDTLSFLGNPLVTGLDSEEVDLFFNQTLLFFQQRLQQDKKVPTIIKKIFEIKYLLKMNNLNPQLAIDNILIFIYKQYKLGI